MFKTVGVIAGFGIGATAKYADEVADLGDDVLGSVYRKKLDIDHDFKGFNLDENSVFFKNADDVAEGGLDVNLLDEMANSGAEYNLADIVEAIEKATGDATERYLVQVTDMTVNYTVEVNSSRNDEYITFEVNPWVGGFKEKDQRNFIETAFDEVYLTVERIKTHEGTIRATDVLNDENNTGAKTINDIHAMGINVGVWTDNPEDTIDFAIDSITLSVEYILEQPISLPAITKRITYDQIKNAEYITIVAKPALDGGCSHDAHINEETGIDERKEKTYCPWVDASFYKEDEN